MIHFDPDDPEDLLRAVRELFNDDDGRPRVPRDVTSTPIPLTRERLKRESDSVGTVGSWTTGGELVEIDDDEPFYAAPIEHHHALVGPTVYFEFQIRALGIDDDELRRDFPGIRTMPDPNTSKENR